MGNGCKATVGLPTLRLMMIFTSLLVHTPVYPIFSTVDTAPSNTRRRKLCVMKKSTEINWKSRQIKDKLVYYLQSI